MAWTRLETEWDRTAGIICKIHNVNCSKRSDMVSDSSTFNPMRQKLKPKKKMSLKEMRKAMEGGISGGG